MYSLGTVFLIQQTSKENFGLNLITFGLEKEKYIELKGFKLHQSQHLHVLT